MCFDVNSFQAWGPLKSFHPHPNHWCTSHIGGYIEVTKYSSFWCEANIIGKESSWVWTPAHGHQFQCERGWASLPVPQSLCTCDAEMVGTLDQMKWFSGRGIVASQELPRQWALAVHMLGELQTGMGRTLNPTMKDFILFLCWHPQLTTPYFTHGFWVLNDITLGDGFILNQKTLPTLFLFHWVLSFQNSLS